MITKSITSILAAMIAAAGCTLANKVTEPTRETYFTPYSVCGEMARDGDMSGAHSSGDLIANHYHASISVEPAKFYEDGSGSICWPTTYQPAERSIPGTVCIPNRGQWMASFLYAVDTAQIRGITPGVPYDVSRSGTEICFEFR